jgi:hypothetical protein
MGGVNYLFYENINCSCRVPGKRQELAPYWLDCIFNWFTGMGNFIIRQRKGDSHFLKGPAR